MRCLLINPEFPDTFWSFRHAISFTRRKTALPPLGLLTLAALLGLGVGRRSPQASIRPAG